MRVFEEAAKIKLTPLAKIRTFLSRGIVLP